MFHLDVYNTCTCNYACTILHRVIYSFKMNVKVITHVCIYQTLWYYFCTANLAMPHVDNCIQMLNIIHVQTKGTIAWYSSFLPISVKLAVIGFPAYLVVWLMNVPLKGVLIGRFFFIDFSFQIPKSRRIN